MYSNEKTPLLTEWRRTASYSKLEISKEWLGLTDLQKSICVNKWSNPDWSQKRIGEACGCSQMAVSKLLATESYQRLSLQVGRQELVAMRALALKALKECLMSEKDTVKLQAARALLESEGLLREAPPLEEDKEYDVSWKKHEDRDSIQSAPKPEGSP